MNGSRPEVQDTELSEVAWLRVVRVVRCDSRCSRGVWAGVEGAVVAKGYGSEAVLRNVRVEVG